MDPRDELFQNDMSYLQKLHEFLSKQNMKITPIHTDLVYDYMLLFESDSGSLIKKTILGQSGIHDTPEIGNIERKILERNIELDQRHVLLIGSLSLINKLHVPHYELSGWLFSASSSYPTCKENCHCAVYGEKLNKFDPEEDFSGSSVLGRLTQEQVDDIKNNGKFLVCYLNGIINSETNRPSSTEFLWFGGNKTVEDICMAKELPYAGQPSCHLRQLENILDKEIKLKPVRRKELKRYISGIIKENFGLRKLPTKKEIGDPRTEDIVSKIFSLIDGGTGPPKDMYR